jgi:hypothetical protein
MDRTMFLKLVSVVGVALFVACTTVGPDYEQPETQMPDAWHTAATEGLEEGDAVLQTWWRVFDDELLDNLVMRSAGGNLTLREAMWRVEEARALRGVVAGVKKPQVGFSGDAARAQPSDNGLAGDFAPPEGFEAGNLFSLGLGAIWEIDVFGRIRRQVEAADATAEASIEAYRDVLVSLYAETALAYVNVRTAQERLRISHDNVDGQEDTLQLTKDQSSAQPPGGAARRTARGPAPGARRRGFDPARAGGGDHRSAGRAAAAAPRCASGRAPAGRANGADRDRHGRSLPDLWPVGLLWCRGDLRR